MKILSIKIGKNILFPEGFCIGLKNLARVSKNSAPHDNYQSAYKIKTGLYNQVLLCLTGINSTGKTTILQLIAGICNLVLMQRTTEVIAPILRKLQITNERSFKFEAEILQDKTVYLLESEIVKNKDEFVYKDEVLYKLPLSKYTKGNKVDDFKLYKSRTEEVNNPFFKSDESIARCLSSKAGVLVTYLDFFRELNKRHETPSIDLIKLFDLAIKDLKIRDYTGDLKTTTACVEFERPGLVEKQVDSLEKIASKGTIKGLSIFPGILTALSSGGYVVIDDLETYFDNRIITYIFDLFTNVKTNPQGACLIFSTHYYELLDYFTRKDNIYVAHQDDSELLKVSRFTEAKKVTFGKILNSKALQYNLIPGSAPKFSVYRNAKNKIMELLNSNAYSI